MPARERATAPPRAPRATPADRPAPNFDDGVPKTRLAMAVGRQDGIRPADVVGSIANEAGIAGRDIGPIEIRDDVTYVSVPAESAELVVRKVGHTRFRGRAVNLRVAGPDSETPRPRPYDRPSRPPRRDFGPPDRGARPARRFAGRREEGDRGAKRPGGAFDRFSRKPGGPRPGRPAPGGRGKKR